MQNVRIQFSGDASDLTTQLESLRTNLRSVSGSVQDVNTQYRVVNGTLRAFTTVSATADTTLARLRTAQHTLSNAVGDANLRLRAQETQIRNLNPPVRSLSERMLDAAGSAGRLATGIIAYKAISGVIDLVGNLAASVFKLGMEFDGAEAALTAAMGSLEAARAELSFLDELAEHAGVSVAELRSQYKLFASASKLVGVSIQETRDIYKSFTIASRTLNLTADETEGVFRALTQMMNKNKIMSEELQNQLGERLPGAVALMAKSMNVTIPQLLKLMKDGKVKASEVMSDFAKTVEETFGGDAFEQARHSLQAEINRAQNAWNDYARFLYLLTDDLATFLVRTWTDTLEDITPDLDLFQSRWEQGYDFITDSSEDASYEMVGTWEDAVDDIMGGFYFQLSFMPLYWDTFVGYAKYGVEQIKYAFFEFFFWVLEGYYNLKADVILLHDSLGGAILATTYNTIAQWLDSWGRAVNNLAATLGVFGGNLVAGVGEQLQRLGGSFLSLADAQQVNTAEAQKSSDAARGMAEDFGFVSMEMGIHKTAAQDASNALRSNTQEVMKRSAYSEALATHLKKESAEFGVTSDITKDLDSNFKELSLSAGKTSGKVKDLGDKAEKAGKKKEKAAKKAKKLKQEVDKVAEAISKSNIELQAEIIKYEEGEDAGKKYILMTEGFTSAQADLKIELDNQKKYWEDLNKLKETNKKNTLDLEMTTKKLSLVQGVNIAKTKELIEQMEDEAYLRDNNIDLMSDEAWEYQNISQAVRQKSLALEVMLSLQEDNNEVDKLKAEVTAMNNGKTALVAYNKERRTRNRLEDLGVDIESDYGKKIAETVSGLENKKAELEAMKTLQTYLDDLDWLDDEIQATKDGKDALIKYNAEKEVYEDLTEKGISLESDLGKKIVESVVQLKKKEQVLDAITKIEELRKENFWMEKEIAATAAGEAALKDFNLQKEISNALEEHGLTLQEEEGKQLAELITKQSEYTNKLQSISDMKQPIQDFFRSAMEDGKKAFTDLGDFLTNWIKDKVAEFAANKIMVYLTGNASGALSFLSGSPSTAAVGQSAGGLLGSVFSAGKSLLGMADGGVLSSLTSGKGFLGGIGESLGLTNGAVSGVMGIAGKAIPAAGLAYTAGEMLGAGNPTAMAALSGIGNVIAPGIGGVIGAAVGSLFGGKKKQEGGGIQVGYDPTQGGFVGEQYTEYSKKKAFWGGTKRWTEYEALAEETNNTLSSFFTSLEDGIVTQLDRFQVSNAEEILNSFTLETVKISGENAQAELEQWLTDSASSAYQTVFAQLPPTLQTALDALVDVSTATSEEIIAGFDALGIMATEIAPAFESVGLSLSSVDEVTQQIGTSSSATASQMHEIILNSTLLSKELGGADNAMKLVEFTLQNIQPASETASSSFTNARNTIIAFNEKLGKTPAIAIKSKEELWNFIQKLDITTGAGREAAAMALSVSGAMDVFTNSIAEVQDQFATTIDNITMDLMDQHEKQEHYMTEAQKLYKDLKAESDPERIAEISREINEAVQNAWSNMTEEQKEANADFLKSMLTSAAEYSEVTMTGALSSAETMQQAMDGMNLTVQAMHEAAADSGDSAESIETATENFADVSEETVKAAQAAAETAISAARAAGDAVNAAADAVNAANAANAAAASAATQAAANAAATKHANDLAAALEAAKEASLAADAANALQNAYDTQQAAEEAAAQAAAAVAAQAAEAVKEDETDGSHSAGLSYVPWDGYIAELHRGERVLTAEEALNYKKPLKLPENLLVKNLVRDLAVNSYKESTSREVDTFNDSALKSVANKLDILIDTVSSQGEYASKQREIQLNVALSAEKNQKLNTKTQELKKRRQLLKG